MMAAEGTGGVVIAGGRIKRKAVLGSVATQDRDDPVDRGPLSVIRIVAHQDDMPNAARDDVVEGGQEREIAFVEDTVDSIRILERPNRRPQTGA